MASVYRLPASVCTRKRDSPRPSAPSPWPAACDPAAEEREAAVTHASRIEGTFGAPGEVVIELSKSVTNVRNLRTGETPPDGKALKAAWKPWEALLFEATWPQP